MTSKKALAGIRAKLEAERQTLQADIATLAVENQAQPDDYGAGNHIADDASEVFARERNMALRDNSEDLLAQIDAALERIEQGTYGVCARCGQPIDPERLEARPYAAYCITCQAEIEQER